MKTLNELCKTFISELRSCIRFKMSSDDINTHIERIKAHQYKTTNGNERYPQYYKTAVNAAMDATRDILVQQNTIFCYEIDGDLYTTFKPFNNNSWFIGFTEIQNYRLAGIEDRLIELRIKNKPIKSGFYYGCGKPYFVKEGI